MSESHIVICGLGYAGAATARAALAAGWRVSATSRDPRGIVPPAGVEVVGFDVAGPVLAQASHVLATAPPGEMGDPVLAAFLPVLFESAALRWAGYLSTTGVYGDRGGAWVDETTPPAPGAVRAVRRVAAEREWSVLADHVAVDVFRVAGIYGPGRSALDDLRAGTARRIDKPGHAFGRIHRDDIAGAVMAACAQARAPGVRVLHLSDDVPAESAAVIEEGARLLGVAPPPLLPYAEAEPRMSEMARSFWAENRKVASALTQQWLGYHWRYPSYREGLRAILAEQQATATPPASRSAAPGPAGATGGDRRP
jgi:nucleoside-diphosphate-sugar epimerase